ncbi:MAG: Fic family protein [Bacteroidetes bacterium]|nr:Fic family protein [Bacteroidota bacterium]
MKPPYTISSRILKLISDISIKIGEANANYLTRQSPHLRKSNRVKTIHSSLQIEGNTLTIDQITAMVDNKRVIGTKKDVLEVQNAIAVYDALSSFNFSDEKSFLKAHKMLMGYLVSNPVKYRTGGVGIVKGSEVKHVAPPASKVPALMKDLFLYLKADVDLPLIKSCVFHYELEFIHPFSDGNGRMGRLWQTVILVKGFHVFEFLPFETLISKRGKAYYDALSKSDKAGNSTYFIEFVLEIIDESLSQLLSYKGRVMTSLDRIEYFLSVGPKEFSRKDYMNVFKDISTATASRDLKNAIDQLKILKIGEKRLARYKIR